MQIDKKWEKHYRSLKMYVKREGHCRVPSRHNEDGFSLGRWVHGQRMSRDKLSKKRTKALEAIKGWNWSGQRAKWERACGKFEQFVKREGHSRVPKLHIEDEFKLGIWVMHQREAYKTGSISNERKKYLEKFPGWNWYGTPNRLPEASADDFAYAIWNILFGYGPLKEPAAFNMCVTNLYDMGLIKTFSVQKTSKVAALIEKAFRQSVKTGYLDRPKPRHVRAILGDGGKYTQDDWRICLLSSLDSNPIKREDAIKNAVVWAEKNLGLKYKQLRTTGVIWKGLQKAIRSLVTDRELIRHGRDKISLA